MTKTSTVSDAEEEKEVREAGAKARRLASEDTEEDKAQAQAEAEAKAKVQAEAEAQAQAKAKAKAKVQAAVIDLALVLNVSLDDNPTLALKWFSWITTLRLFSVRACREDYVWEGSYSVNWNGYAAILQFSYILEFIPCFMQFCEEDFDFRSNNEWQSNFTNAFVWAIVNGISYGTGFAWLNLIGFAFDIWHDYYYTDQEIKAQEKKLKLFSGNTDGRNIIQANIQELKVKKIRVTCVAVALFIGMGLFYLNPISSGAAIAGAFLVFIFGGIIGNLGNRLVQWDKRLFIWFSKEDDSLKDILRKELEKTSYFGKLFKEFIKPLSPTLFNSLEDFTKDSVNALSCIMFASVPAIAFAYAWSHYFNMSFFVIAPVHMLLITAVILIVIEICARLGNHFTYQTRVENIRRKLNNMSENAESQSTDAHPFSCFSAQEIETLAHLDGKSLKGLLGHIYDIDQDACNSLQNSNSISQLDKQFSKKLLGYRSNIFNMFKDKIQHQGQDPKKIESPESPAYAS